MSSITYDAVVQSFTQALFQLAAHPEYLLPLREEVEAITSEEGWTKAAMGKMLKIDSFIRESIRYEGLGARAYFLPVLPHLLHADIHAQSS